MKNKKGTITFLFIFVMLLSFGNVFAAKANLPSLMCTHEVFEDDEPSQYHYAYCDICGECKEQTEHSFTYSQYNMLYHKVSCSCGYITYKSHNWSGGDTTAHKCSTCGLVHSKSEDATKGLHYFAIEKIRKAGNVAPCEVCGKYLTLTYSADSILDELPKKEEYTMIGNPNPMEEKTLDTDQIIEVNFMPINEDGELIPIDELFLRVRLYTNGNYFSHYSKLVGEELNKITELVQYLDNPETIDYIVEELSEMGALGGYNEAQKEEILNKIEEMVEEDPSLSRYDLYSITNVVSKLGDFALKAIKTPILEWFEQDLAIKNTWLSGGTTTLRYEFEGTMENSAGRKFTIYFSELPDGKYEILRSPLLTYGIDFSTYSYSLGGYTNLMYSTLFNKGNTKPDPPTDILAYVSIAYRDTNGNVIYTKSGKLATPTDTVVSGVVYSGTSERTITRIITASMDWTQLSGYRYKGYLLKGGLYSIYNNPAEMVITTNSSVSVTSSFTPHGLRNEFSILF